MKYDFDKKFSRKNTNSVKWKWMHHLYPDATSDCLPFWVADMDLPAAEPIIKALEKRTKHPAFGYTMHQTESYNSALCQWFYKRFQWEVNAKEIFYSPGIVTAIALTIRMLTKKNEGVIIQQPIYHPFIEMIKKNKRKLVNNSLIIKNGRYCIDFDDFERKAKDPNNKLLLLCSPHNPVGRVWSKDELFEIVRICSENNVYIFSDEIHQDLIRKNKKHFPLSKLCPNEKDLIIVATAPSKTFNIPGLQMSNLIIHNKRLQIKYKRQLNALAIWTGNIFGATATEAAYQKGEDWLEQLIDYLDSNFAFFKMYLSEKLPKTVLYETEGTYLAWVDFSKYGYTHQQLIDVFVKEAKVVCSDGKIFGNEGDGFMRFNFACSRSMLKEGIDRISQKIM